jgi:hypothetical protein
MPEADAPSLESERSLIEDVEALIDDGKTYLEAEIAYQKTRAIYVADKAKSALIYGAVAASFAFLALVGLTVGLIIALTPLLTAWGASALVVGLLVIGALIAARAAAERWNRLMGAIETPGNTRGERKP